MNGVQSQDKFRSQALVVWEPGRSGNLDGLGTRPVFSNSKQCSRAHAGSGDIFPRPVRIATYNSTSTSISTVVNTQVCDNCLVAHILCAVRLTSKVHFFLLLEPVL